MMPKDSLVMGTGYKALGSAVVLQAVRDWRFAVRQLRKHPNSMSARSMLSEVEEFFCSRRFNYFTELDGEELLRQLRLEAGMEVVA